MENRLTVRDTFYQPQVLSSFKDVLGGQANAYIASVLIAIANNDALQACTPSSVVKSAMRAATLRLTCDPSVGEAYLVPFKGQATLVIGYKGLRTMALRTGKYRYMNVSPIYEGEEIVEDRLTGMHSLSGNRTGKAVIGYLLYFELVTGFRKSFYMTTEEILAHAQRYSRGFSRQDSAWKTNFPEMARKTVLRLGLSLWGYFDPHDTAVLSEIDSEEVVLTEATEVEEDLEQQPTEPEQPAQPKSVEQTMLELGY